MKLKELVVAQGALERLLALELPAAMSYKIVRAVRPILIELRNYERERIRLFHRFGIDTGQGQIAVASENIPQFNEELNALLDIDIELGIGKVNLDTLGEVNIRPGDLVALEFLFEGLFDPKDNDE